MTIDLRYTQTQVNPLFASHALHSVCAPCKTKNMHVRLEEIRGIRTLEEMAAAIGVEISTIQRWEKHSMSIPSKRLPEIAKAYGCSVADIFSDDALAVPGEVISLWSRIPLEDRPLARDVLKTFASR